MSKHSTNIMKQMLEAVKYSIPINSTWKHYKGGVYNVVGYSIDTTIDDVAIRYKRIDGPGFDSWEEEHIFFSRPAAEWQELIFSTEVNHQCYINRFKRVKYIEVPTYVDYDAR